MAKTTSQIVAENKNEQKEYAKLDATRAEIDKKQTDPNAAAKTAAVLNGTSDKLVKTSKTSASDTQKQKVQQQKDEAEHQKTPEPVKAEHETPSASELQAQQAKKRLEEYRNSEEKKKNAEKRMQDKYAQQLLYGITDSSEVLYDEDPREKELQAEADYWDNKVKQEADEKLFSSNMQEIQNLSGAERTAFENYANNRTFVDPENLEAYKRLKERYGDKLNDLKYTYQRDKEEKAAQAVAGYTAGKMDQGGALADTGRNVLSLGANLMGSITGTAGRINEMVNGTGPYQTAARHTYGDIPSVYGQTVRDKTSEQILAGQDLNIGDGISGRELGAIAYQGGMGALDTGARLLASGGNPFLAASMAASQTFSNTVQEAAEKGATPQEAYALATVSAGIEALTEKLPLDNLVSIAKGGANPKMIVNLLLQAGVEIGEEEASLIGTTLAEMAILKEKSDYQQSIRKAVAMGVPYEQAVAEADRALLEEAKQTALVSGFSGLLSAGGAEAGNRLLGGNQSQQQTAQQPAAAQQEQTPVQTEQSAQPAQPVQDAQEQNQTQQEQPTATAPETKPEAPAQQQKADPDWAEQTFRELDEQRKSDKERQQKAYEAVKAEERKVNQLEKDIAKAEKKLAETGKGSQARIDQMKQELERQKGIVAQKQRFLDYQDSSYDTNLESAVKTQQDLYENARMQVTLAIADYNDGRISEAQLQDAKDTYNNAGQELYRLKNMTPEQYRMELVSMGLLGDMAGKPNTERPVADTKAAPVQTQQETAQQTPKAAETPLQKVTDTVTETITGRPAAISQTSTQQTDTQNRAKPEPVMVQEQSAEGGQIKGTGAAETGFTPKQAMINEYGNIPEGENPVRPDQFPRSTDGNDRVSYTARTAAEARVTPDEFVPLIEHEVVNQGFSFIPITNDETVQNATRRISYEGWQTSRANWTSQIRAGVTSPEITATGAILYNHAVNIGDTQEAMDILMDYQMAVRNTARSLQAARILKTLTPSDRLYMIRRSVDAMVQDMHLDNPVTIPESLAQSYQNAGTQEEADEILDMIADDIARQIPATRMEAFTALRYLNMLGNFRTQGRNIAGNVGSKLVYGLKDKVGATVEAIASGLTNGRVERTKAFVTDRATRQAAAADYEQVRDWVMGNGRYNDSQTESDDFARRVQDRRQMLPRGLEEARRATEWAMNTGDEIFARDAYARALAGYLNARGIRTDNLETVAPGLLDNAREYAVRQAQEQTFRDNNQVSDFVSGIMRGRNTPTWARVIGEGVMPFRRTPANVLVRAEEFSPLGLINSAVNTVRAAQGNISGEQLIDSWAKSLTGTALTAMGWALYGMGVLSGGPDDDEDAEAYDQMNGNQNYAIRLKIGDREFTYTIDWATPAAMPMFLGAQLKKAFDNTEDLDWADAEKVLTSIGDPLIQMSMLQGVNDTLDSIKYSDNSMGQFLINAVVSFVTQGIGNTLLGQLEKSTEDKRMMTYVDKDSAVPEWMQKQLGKLSQKIPGWDYQQTEYINARGETEEQPTGAAGLAYNMLSPGYAKEVTTDAVTEEMNRLNDANIEGNVFPKTPDKTITWTDKAGNVHEDYNLTPEEYQTMAKTQGQTEQQIKEELIETSAYKAMTDQQKADVVDMVQNYAREAGRAAALPDYDGMENWMKDITPDNAVDTIIRKAVDSSITGAFDDIADDWKRGNDTAQSVEAMDQAYKNYQALGPIGRKDFYKDASGRVKYFIDAKNAGMKTGTFADMYKKYQDIDKMDAGVSEKAQEWSYALEKAVDSGAITERQKDIMKKDMKFRYSFAAETEKFDKMIESGIPTDRADSVIEALSKAIGTGSNGSVRDIDTRQTIAEMPGLSDSEIDEIMKCYMADYDPEAESKEYTELKYNYVRFALGLSPDEYAETYRAHLDNSKKAEKVAAIMALGYDKKTAVELYNVYSGNAKGKNAYIGYYNSR